MDERGHFRWTDDIASPGDSCIGDLACAVELERWDARLASTGATVTLELRITHVYRREEGSWKLIHRHGDHLKPKGAIDALAEE